MVSTRSSPPGSLPQDVERRRKSAVRALPIPDIRLQNADRVLGSRGLGVLGPEHRAPQPQRLAIRRDRRGEVARQSVGIALELQDRDRRGVIGPVADAVTLERGFEMGERVSRRSQQQIQNPLDLRILGAVRGPSHDRLEAIELHLGLFEISGVRIEARVVDPIRGGADRSSELFRRGRFSDGFVSPAELELNLREQIVKLHPFGGRVGRLRMFAGEQRGFERLTIEGALVELQRNREVLLVGDFGEYFAIGRGCGCASAQFLERSTDRGIDRAIGRPALRRRPARSARVQPHELRGFVAGPVLGFHGGEKIFESGARVATRLAQVRGSTRHGDQVR